MSDASWIMPFDRKLLMCIQAAPPTVDAATAVRASRTAPTDTRTLPGFFPAVHRTNYLASAPESRTITDLRRTLSHLRRAVAARHPSDREEGPGSGQIVATR